MSNAVYLDQIRQLVELQKVDDEIFAVKQEMEKMPREISNLEKQFSIVDNQRNHILDKLSHLKEQQKRLSLEIDDDSAKLRKSKNKLMQVGNTREYHAMIREMDSMEKINRSREEEKTTLLEELQLQNTALDNITKEHTKITEELKQKRANLEESLKKNEEILKVLNAKRIEASKDIPMPVFMRYEFIKVRLDHPVIVSVSEGVCSGCNVAVPPQTFIELQRGQQILSCPSCQRLIFWDEHFGEKKAKKQIENKESNDVEIIEDNSEEQKVSKPKAKKAATKKTSEKKTAEKNKKETKETKKTSSKSSTKTTASKTTKKTTKK